MKISLFLFCVGVFQVFAANNYAQNTKLTLSMENTTIADALQAIEDQSEFKFFYNNQLVDINKVVSVKAKRDIIWDVLNQVLPEAGITYHIVGKQVALFSEVPTSDKKIIQQPHTITGKVMDETGAPLPGVSIMIKGMTMGTVTNLEGEYTIQVPDPSTAVMVFSYVGYLAQEISIGSQTKIDITMEPDVYGLEEVVVVGYGLQKKGNLTGAISVVSMEDVQFRPITSAGQALQGLASGVTVYSHGGQPGRDDPRIRIRGVDFGVNTPLILIDGVESTLYEMNPNDMQSISVLKDAAATAIYGSRAGNGVILITTKRGKSGELSVSYDNYFGWQEATDVPRMITNSAEYMTMLNTGRTNVGQEPFFPQEMIDEWVNSNDKYHPNTDWFDELYRKAPMSEHNIAISGGKEETTFRFSTRIQQQDGVMLGTSAEKYNMRLNIDSKATERLSFGVSIAGAWNKMSEVAGRKDDAQLLGNMSAAPNTAVYLPDGSGRYSWSSQAIRAPGAPSNRNVIAFAHSGEDITDNQQFLGNAFAEYKIIEGLRLKVSAAIRYDNYLTSELKESVLQYDWYAAPDDEPFRIDFPIPKITNSNSTTLFYNVYSTLTYYKSIGNHNIRALIGYNEEKSRNDNFSGFREYLVSTTIHEIDGGSTDRANSYISGSASHWALRSFFSRLNYNYMERYLFEANVRSDASSIFHEDNRWKAFPSFSAGWRISEEPFMENLSFLEQLKVRASWGQSGEQRGIGNYPYISSVNITDGYLFGMPGSESVFSGAAVTSLSNQDVTWQTNTTLDIGIEAGLFRNALTFELDYFIKTIDDLLGAAELTALSGLSAPKDNTLAVENRGWEALISYRGNIGDFTYGISGNLTKVKNEVTDYNGQITKSARWIIQEGLPIRTPYLIPWEGIYQTQEDVDAGPFIIAGTSPGDLKYTDVNGDGQITPDDRVPVGNPFPEYMYGFTLNAGYKGIDISCFFQGVENHDFLVTGWGTEVFQQGSVTEKFRDAWTPENTDTDVYRLVYPSGYKGNRPGPFPSTYYLEDASYLRLKNLQIGYTLPNSLTKKIRIDHLRIFVNGQNLLTFTDYEQGFDPERYSETDPNGGGNRLVNYPQVKIFSAGLNVRF